MADELHAPTLAKAQNVQSIVDAFTSTHGLAVAFPVTGHLVRIDEAQQFNQTLKKIADASEINPKEPPHRKPGCPCSLIFFYIR